MKKWTKRLTKVAMTSTLTVAWMLPTVASAAPAQNIQDILGNLFQQIPGQFQPGSMPSCPVMPQVPGTPQPPQVTVPSQPTPAPTPTPKPTPTPPANTGSQTNEEQSNFASQVVNIVNQERAKAGLPALQSDDRLANMAMDKAKDMYTNNYFDHQSPTYGSPFDMMNQYQIKYGYAGENIAKGQQSPAQVMQDWMNSQGHRENIMNPNFTHIGVAYYQGEWVQEFISKA